MWYYFKGALSVVLAEIKIESFTIICELLLILLTDTLYVFHSVLHDLEPEYGFHCWVSPGSCWHGVWGSPLQNQENRDQISTSSIKWDLMDRFKDYKIISSLLSRRLWFWKICFCLITFKYGVIIYKWWVRVIFHNLFHSVGLLFVLHPLDCWWQKKSIWLI